MPQVLQAPAKSTAPSLKDMMEDGIYLLFLLKSGNPPNSFLEFNKRIDQFLLQFEKNAQLYDKPQHAITEAKYAFCALIDEVILSSTFSIRAEWEVGPLQMRLFGEHLAGDHFFDKLDILRGDPAENIDVLEIFYSFLLLGFQGKYVLEGEEKLSYLINRLNQEIAHVRGSNAVFSPNWKLPHQFQQYIRSEMPIWLFFAPLTIVGAAIFSVYLWLLNDATDNVNQQQGNPAFSTNNTNKSALSDNGVSLDLF